MFEQYRAEAEQSIIAEETEVIALDALIDEKELLRDEGKSRIQELRDGLAHYAFTQLAHEDSSKGYIEALLITIEPEERLIIVQRLQKIAQLRDASEEIIVVMKSGTTTVIPTGGITLNATRGGVLLNGNSIGSGHYNRSLSLLPPDATSLDGNGTVVGIDELAQYVEAMRPNDAKGELSYPLALALCAHDQTISLWRGMPQQMQDAHRDTALQDLAWIADSYVDDFDSIVDKIPAIRRLLGAYADCPDLKDERTLDESIDRIALQHRERLEITPFMLGMNARYKYDELLRGRSRGLEY